MSESGSEKGEKDRNGGVRAVGGGRQGEEIATKSFMIQSKRFYLDVKQNDRGRFVKLAEVALNGRKNRLFMSMRICKNIKEILDKLEKEGYTANEQPKESDKNEGGGVIYTETIINDKRRYYVDLRENQRGVFLRITQFEVQTGNRNSVALPVQGVGQFRDALEELIDEYGEGYLDEDVDLPESQTFRTDGKNFYFDPGHNSRGDFLKITELKPSIGVRNTIALSVKAIPQFTKVLNKLYEDFQTMREAEGGEKMAAIENAPKEDSAVGKDVKPPAGESKNGDSSSKKAEEGAQKT